MRRDPAVLGITILSLVILSVISIVILALQSRINETVATVSIGGIGAIATALLALATFWTIKQNEETLQNLERERKKPIKVSILSEIIQPAIESTEANINKLTSDGQVWGTSERNVFKYKINLKKPPTETQVDSAIWEEFQDQYPELCSEFSKWLSIYSDIEEISENLSENLQESNIARNDLQLKHIMNCAEPDEDFEDLILQKYRLSYENFSDKFHEYWRLQWRLLNLNDNIRINLISLKRELQKEYGISNEEI